MFLLFAQRSYNNNFLCMHAVKLHPNSRDVFMLMSSVSLHEIDGEDAEDHL